MRLRKIFFIGNAHIDPVWLWDWKEGVSEVLKTFSDAVKLLENFPRSFFTASSTMFYEWLETIDYDLFKEVKDFISQGRWEIVGGWIVEPDCNIPSGESFVRHSLYGQSYYYSRFGKRALVGYNIDSFGHNWNLPQILSKSGMKYYVFMRPGPHEKDIPSPIFWWEAPDGSRVLAYRIPYSYANSGKRIEERTKKLIEEYGDVSELLIMFFGRGDHGGGPTWEELKIIEGMNGYKGVKMSSSVLEYAFKEIEELIKKGRLNVPVVKDELQYHAVGCYSVVHLVKKLNRIAEHYLLAAERISTVASLLSDYEYSDSNIRDAWKKVLFNQFHDILAGSSIRKAYEEDVIRRFHSAIQTADDIITFSIKSIEKNIGIKGSGSFFIIWNLNTFPIKFPIEYEAQLSDINEMEKAVLREVDSGNIIPFERLPKLSKTGARRINIRFIADLPALGYKVYNIAEDSNISSIGEADIVQSNIIENDFYIVKKGSSAGFERIIFKQENISLFKDNVFSLFVADDNTDTWTHETNRYPKEGEYIELKECSVKKSSIGEHIECVGRYNESKIRLSISLYKDIRFLDIKVYVDWHEKHKILKLIVPLSLQEPVVTIEIPYGSIQRKNEYIERPMQRWIDVSGIVNGKRMGVTIVNDGIYSYDFCDNALRLTLLRSPLYAHHIPYKPTEHPKEEYTDQGSHRYRFLVAIHEGNVNKVLATELASVLNTPMYGVLAFPKRGLLKSSASFLNVEPRNVKVEVLKKCERDNGIIVRMYEVDGQRSKGVLEILGHRYSFEINGYEIKTFKINLYTDEVREVNLLEE